MGNADAVRRYRERNPEKVRGLRAAWGAQNKERIANYTRMYNLRRKGFTTDSYALALSTQEHACAICKTPFTELDARAVHADHDHQQNVARGVLCHYCNVGLGVFRDSPELLNAAANYLANPTMKEIAMLEPKVEDLKFAIEKNTETLQSLIALLSDPSALKIASAPVAEPKKEKPVTEKKPNGIAHTAADESKTITAAATSGETQTETASVIDYETVKAAVIKLSQAKGRKVVVDVLSRFGAQKAPDLLPAQYADALAKIQSVIDGGAV